MTKTAINSRRMKPSYAIKFPW